MYTETTPLAFARNTDPATSQQAAKTVNVTYLEGKVLAAIKAAGEKGATQDELVEALKLPSNSITPRFKPLLRKGVVVDTGTTRKGHWSGKRQRVMFVPADLGINVVVASSKDAIVRGVEAERLRREDFATMQANLKSAKGHLLAAEQVAKKHGFEILEYIAGETKLYNPSEGVWQQPPQAA